MHVLLKGELFCCGEQWQAVMDYNFDWKLRWKSEV